MIQRVVLPLLAVVIAGVIISSLPDIARYLKIREM